MRLNKKTFFVSLIVISTMSVVFILYKSKNNNVLPTPTPSTGINSVQPGTSTIDDLTKVMGGPKNRIGDELFYNSKSPTRDTTVILSGQTVGLIKEIVAYSENRNINEVKSKYGDANNVLYGESAVNGNYLFVYLEKGIAYLGNPNTETLMEIWRFSPILDINTFIKTWGSGYSEEYPTGSF